jgi:CheY-like chemotaxis protein
VRRRAGSIAAALARLGGLDDPAARTRLLDELARDAHTLRGSAATIGLADAAELAGGLERVVARLREGGDAPEPDLLESLRAAMADLAAAGVPAAPGPVAGDEPASAGARTVLHVDDNPADRELVRVLLHRDPRFRLVSAEDGAAALRLAREERPAVILLDLQLPDMSGDELLAALLADPETAAIPVVVASADAMPETERRLAELGAHAFASKPFDLRQLVEVLATA